MNSITTESDKSPPEAEAAPLVFWPKLSVAEQAFVTAYVESSYSLREAAESLKMSHGAAAKMLKSQGVRGAIFEVQSELNDLDFLNEKWVKAQLLKLFPMVMGEEPAAFVTNQGEEVAACKFYPDIAMKILDYVAPKKQAPVVIQHDKDAPLIMKLVADTNDLLSKIQQK